MYIDELLTRKLCVTSIKFWGRLMKRKLWVAERKYRQIMHL